MENEFVNKATIEQEAEKSAKAKPKKQRKVNASVGKTSRAFSQILNGDFLTKEFVLNNLNYIFFVIFLLLLVVAKGYYGKQLSKDVDTTQHQLDEATAEYVEAKAKLEEVTRRQVLVDELGPKGLKETVNPTKVIRLKKDEGK